MCYDQLNQWQLFGEYITRHLVIQITRDEIENVSQKVRHSKSLVHISICALQNLTFREISGITCNPTVYGWCCNWSWQWHFCNSLLWFNSCHEPSPMQPFTYSPTSRTGERFRRKREENSCDDIKDILIGKKIVYAQKQSKTRN